MSGAVPGTPGTTPSLMTGITNPAGLSTSVVGSGTEDGIPYVDIRFFGTSNGASITFRTDYAGAIACTSGQTFTGSVYNKIVGGTLTNVAGVAADLQFYDSVGNVTENVNGPAVALTSNALPQNRLVVTGAAANVLSVSVMVRCVLVLSAAAATDVTLRLGQPQLLLSSFAMSDIITTTAAVTRAADNLTLDLTQLPNLQTPAGYGVALEFSVIDNNQPGVVYFGVSIGTDPVNTWYMRHTSFGGSTARISSWVAGTVASSSFLSLRTAGLINRAAFSVTPAGIRWVLNGSAVTNLAKPGQPVMTNMVVGRMPWDNTNFAAMHATTVTLIPGPQSDAWLSEMAY